MAMPRDAASGLTKNDRSMVAWLMRIVAMLTALVAVVLLWRGLLILSLGIAASVVGAYVVVQWRKWRAIRRFRAFCGPQGKNLLLVYSDSPHWERYIEENWSSVERHGRS